ncbi:CaM_binding domain-containing protein, partial [Cephalotus follicularis]
GTQLTKKLEVSRSNKPGATCSSTLKDSKNPPNKPGGSESEGICPYSYCSLHGHRHGASPPLTRFVSIRQRLLTSQKSIEPEGQITLEPKPCGNMKKGIQTHKMAHNENPAAVQEKSHYSKAFSSITEEDRVDLHCYNLFLKPDDHLSTSHEEIPTVKKIHQRSNDEETITSPNVEKRNLRLWHLIYRYMATGIAAENKSPSSLDGEDKEEQLEDACTLLGTNDSRFCQVLSGAVQNKSVEDHDGGSQKIQLELYKTDAIKLVQQAFDRILLEIPDKSPDDQSVMPETTLIQEFSEKNHGEGEEMSSSTPDSAMHTIIQASEEMQLKADHINSYKEEKAESMDGNKSNQKFPKGWSNLKKSIILKRFVKALENVRKLNPRKSRNPAMEHDPEAENFHLRHQMTKERKNAEEWMLDYALQQVVSRLAPAQKRKVALLVQAFETVVPPPGIETHVRSSLAQSVDGTGKERNFGILLRKRSCPETSLKENLDKVGDFDRVEQQILATCGQVKETSLECGCTETASNTTNTVSKEEEIDASNLGNGEVSSNVNNASGEQSKEPKSPTAANEGDPKSEYKCLEGLPPLKDSEHSCNPDVAHETQLQKQKHGRLWYLIYKHMVSANQNMSIDNQNAGTQNFELCQIEAIKLVEEAIDEIPLPEIQDYSPHDQSTTSDKIPDEKLQEEGEGGDFSSSTTFADSIKNRNNSKPQRSWSNLKKLILLKRFIKALEKVKDFNPRGPRYLRSDPDHDAEKVLLSHRDIEDRKNAEEWMLDYAMQQVVAKLTPARKRRVALLVEAFESVIPTIGS